MTTFTDPAHLPIGSQHVFALGNARMVFTRVPGGWNGAGRYWDDASLDDHGWRWVRAAD